MPDDKPIVRCVCRDRTFAFLRDSGVVSLEQIREIYGCGTGCGLCLPFLARMLETGETEFAVEPSDAECP